LAVMSLFAGTLFDKYGGEIISIISFSLFCLSTLAFYFMLDLDTPFVIAMVFFMLPMYCVALFYMSIMTDWFYSFHQSLLLYSKTLLTSVCKFGGSLVLTLIISFIIMTV